MFLWSFPIDVIHFYAIESRNIENLILFIKVLSMFSVSALGRMPELPEQVGQVFSWNDSSVQRQSVRNMIASFLQRGAMRKPNLTRSTRAGGRRIPFSNLTGSL